MKKVLLFLVLLAGVGGTGYLCLQTNEAISAQNDLDYQQENAVSVQLVSVKEETTETTVETTTEAVTETTTESVQDTLPDYQDAIGAYVVTETCSLADTAGAQTGGTALEVNLVVAVMAQEEIDGVTWDQVEYYGMSGWVPDADLARLGDGQKMQESTGAYVFVKPGESITVYAESCTADERAALAAGESTQAAEAGTLDYGSELTVEEADGDWVRITSGEVTGWIPACSVSAYYPNTYYYADTDINLRSNPGMDDEKVSTLAVGTTVLLSEFQNGWAKVESGGQTGWAALYYMTPCENSDGGAALQTVTPTPTPTPTAAPAESSSSSSAGFSSGTGQTTVSEPSTTVNTTTGENTEPTTTGGSTEPSTNSSESEGELEWIPDVGTEDVLEWE